MVAIKIVRGIKKYKEAAMIEIEVLQQLGKHDKGGNRWVFLTYLLPDLLPMPTMWPAYLCLFVYG